jgi:hypothetical protein
MRFGVRISRVVSYHKGKVVYQRCSRARAEFKLQNELESNSRNEAKEEEAGC